MCIYDILCVCVCKCLHLMNMSLYILCIVSVCVYQRKCGWIDRWMDKYVCTDVYLMTCWS